MSGILIRLSGITKKCKSRSKCLVLECITGLAARITTLRLSEYSIGGEMCIRRL